MNWISSLVGLLSGVTASLGLGGGFVLLIYLCAIAETPQLLAQGINLVFFLPIAVLSLIFHAKNGLVETKPLLPSIICGIIGVCGGALLAFWIPTDWLQKIFAIFILIVGIKEVFAKKKKSS